MEQRKQMVEEVNIFRVKVLTRETFFPVSCLYNLCTLPAISTHRASVLSLLFRTTIRALPWSSLVWAPTPIKLGQFIWTQEFSQLLCFSRYWYFIPFCGKKRKNCFISLFILPGHFHQKMRLHLHF